LLEKLTETAVPLVVTFADLFWTIDTMLLACKAESRIRKHKNGSDESRIRKLLLGKCDIHA